MQGSSFSQKNSCNTLTANLKSHLKILKNLFFFNHSTASPLRWKQSLLPLLSPVCVDLSNSSQTYDCLFGTTCKEFHFFFLSYKFFFHFSVLLFHILKAFLPSHNVNLILKLLWKVCFWKSAPHPHSKYLFPLSNLQSSFARSNMWNFCFFQHNLFAFYSDIHKDYLCE